MKTLEAPLVFTLSAPKSFCKCTLLKNTRHPRETIGIEGNPDSEVLLLLKYKYPRDHLSIIFNFFAERGYTKEKLQTCYALGCIPLEGNEPRQYSIYSMCSTMNITSMIKEAAPKVILVDGYALKIITMGANIQCHSFHNDVKINRTQSLPTGFYSTIFNAWILPLPDSWGWIGQTGQKKVEHVYDNFHTRFVEKQIAQIENYRNKEVTEETFESIYVENPNAFLEEHMGETECAFDIETTSLNPYKGNPFSLQFAFDETTGYYLDWDKVDKEVLIRFFRSPKELKVACANGKYDIKWLIVHGIPNAHYEYDVNTAGHVIHSGRSNGLKENTTYHTNLGGYDNELDVIKRKRKIENYSYIPQDIMVKYSCGDTVVTMKLKRILSSLMSSAQTTFFEETCMPVSKVLIDAEVRGLLIDEKYLIDYRIKVEKKVKIIESDITKLLDPHLKKYNSEVYSKTSKIIIIEDSGEGSVKKKANDVGTINLDNISSPDNIRKIFFKVLGADQKVKTLESGEASVADAALQQWRMHGKTDIIKRLATLMISHRESTKLVTGFLSDGTKKKFRREIEDEAPLSFNSDPDPYALADPNTVKDKETTILQNLERIPTDKTFEKRDDWLLREPGQSILHANLNPTGTKVQRLSGSNPNLQNMPIKSNYEFRKVFQARPGYYLAECDYGGFHLRIMAMISADPALCAAFKSDDPREKDLHSKTASALFTDYSLFDFIHHLKGEDKVLAKTLKDYRSQAKVVNFGFLYGRHSGPFADQELQGEKGWSLEKALSYFNENALRVDSKLQWAVDNGRMTRESSIYYACAEKIRDDFFKLYPGVEAYINRTRKFAQSHSYVVSLFGLRIYLPELGCTGSEHEEKRLRGLLNECVNYPVIMTEAQIMQKAMVRLYNHFKTVKAFPAILNQIHDSVLIEFPKAEVNSSLGQDIHDLMVMDFPEYNGIKLDAEAEYAPYWGGHSDKDHPDHAKTWFE